MSHTSRGLGERCIRRESPECPSRVVIRLREGAIRPRTTAIRPRNAQCPREQLIRPSEVGMRSGITAIRPRNARALKRTAYPSENYNHPTAKKSSE